MNKIVSPLMTLGFLASCVTASQAASVTFASYQQQSPSTTGFTLSGASSGGTLRATDGGPGGSLPVLFTFGALAPNSLINQQVLANLTFTAATSGTAAPTQGGQGSSQPFNTVTFQFTSASNQTINGQAVAAGANLLTGTSGFSTGPGGTLAGTNNGTSATFSGSDVTAGSPLFFNTVTFTSQFITFTPGQNAFAYSFSGVNPSFTTGGTFPAQFINSFTASSTGTFSTSAVPEPGSVALLVGMGVTGASFLARRRRAKIVA